jgi:hypothetical protein
MELSGITEQGLAGHGGQVGRKVNGAGADALHRESGDGGERFDTSEETSTRVG